MFKMIKFILVFLILFSFVYFNSDEIEFEISEILHRSNKMVYENNSNMGVYFCPRDNCSKVFYDLVHKYDDIKCVFYDLDDPTLIDKLLEKDAKVYLEEDNRLDEFNHGNSYALMHNKFCIFDEKILITGSMNPTVNGMQNNNNNLFVIESKYLILNYLDEFEEIKGNRFGGGDIVRYPKINYSGILIENYFCPEDHCKDNILRILDIANESIYFMTFSFTDIDIADKLIEKSLDGVNVKGIMEKRRVNMQYNLFSYLNSSGVEVIKDNNNHIMHHKVFIVDKNIVIFGSYNPTKSGNQKNDENILIVYDEKIASRFLEEFDYLIG